MDASQQERSPVHELLGPFQLHLKLIAPFWRASFEGFEAVDSSYLSLREAGLLPEVLAEGLLAQTDGAEPRQNWEWPRGLGQPKAGPGLPMACGWYRVYFRLRSLARPGALWGALGREVRPATRKYLEAPAAAWGRFEGHSIYLASSSTSF